MSFSKRELDSAYELVFNYAFGASQPAQIPRRDQKDNLADSLKEFSSASTTPEAPALSPRPENPKLREIIFDGKLVVKGYIAGEVSSDHGELVIEPSGEIDGDICVSRVTIHGSVRGDIWATHKVELCSTARVIGDIETTELLIQPGATFKGQCTFPRTPLQSDDEFAAMDESEELAFALG